jgi:ABC-type bacteriocin/lantibiotic exporter with double-glycine peptidase domain
MPSPIRSTGTPAASIFQVAGPNHVVAVAVIAGIALVGAVCPLAYRSAVLAETMGARVGIRLRGALLSRLARLPICVVRTQRKGDLVARLTADGPTRAP